MSLAAVDGKGCFCQINSNRCHLYCRALFIRVVRPALHFGTADAVRGGVDHLIRERRGRGVRGCRRLASQGGAWRAAVGRLAQDGDMHPGTENQRSPSLWKATGLRGVLRVCGRLDFFGHGYETSRHKKIMMIVYTGRKNAMTIKAMQAVRFQSNQGGLGAGILVGKTELV